MTIQYRKGDKVSVKFTGFVTKDVDDTTGVRWLDIAETTFSASFEPHLTFPLAAAGFPQAEVTVLHKTVPGLPLGQIGPEGGETLKPAQEVRVTFTGTVMPQTPQEAVDGISPVTEATTGRNVYVPTHPDGTGFEVEVVETYEKDAVYLDNFGVMFLHKGGKEFPSWIRLPDLHMAGWNVPVRPLTKLGAVPS